MIGDVKLTLDGITYLGGQPEMDDGLSTSVYISLFTDSNWWGDSIGSTLYKLDDSTVTNQLRVEIIQAVKNCLSWMVESKIADSIDVEAYIKKESVLLEITINQPEKSFKFEIPWRNT